MHLFTFEPGDGYSYLVLFGRMPGRGLVPFYTVFGIAEGSSDPGVWYGFDTDQVSEATFYNYLHTANMQTYETSWRLWLALTGQADDSDAASRLPAWRPDWRAQLPTAAMG